MRTLKQFLSVEEFDEAVVEPVVVTEPAEEEAVAIVNEVEVPEVAEVVSDDDLIEAQVVLAEVEDDVREVEVERVKAEVIQDELEERILSVEHHMEVLSHGIQHKSYNAQFAASVDFVLKNNQRALGQEDGVLSVESYDKETLADYYVASFEAFEGVLKKLKALSDTVKGKIAKRIQMIGSEAKHVSAINTRADKVLSELKEVSTSEAVEVSVKGYDTSLHLNGTFPGDLVAAAKQDLVASTYLAKTYPKAIVAYANKLVSDLAKTDGQNLPAQVEKTVEETIKAKHPFDSVPAKYKDGTALFAGKIIFEGMEGQSTVTPSNVEELKKMAQTGPIIELEDIKLKSSPEVKLTKAQVQAIAEVAKQYAGVIKDLSEKSVSVEANKTVEQLSKERAKAPSTADSVNDLNSHAANSAYNAVYSEFLAALHLRESAISLLNVAERGVVALKKADKTEKKDDE